MILGTRTKKLLIDALSNFLIHQIRIHEITPPPHQWSIHEIEATIALWRKDLERHERAERLSHERNQRKHSRRTQRGPIQ